MAFLAEEVESAAPNAWTGKPTALVYQLPSEIATWLVRRGYAVFAAAEAADQEAILLRVTEVAEDVVREWFRGRAIQAGQRLLFPARGAYDGAGNLVEQDTAPSGYLEGIALMCELDAAGKFLPSAADPMLAAIAEEGSRRGRIVYRGNVDPAALSTQHPEVWRKLRQAIPRFI